MPLGVGADPDMWEVMTCLGDVPKQRQRVGKCALRLFVIAADDEDVVDAGMGQPVEYLVELGCVAELARRQMWSGPQPGGGQGLGQGDRGLDLPGWRRGHGRPGPPRL